MRASAIATVLVAALLGGCGGEEGAAKKTVSRAISGLSAGDSKLVCDQLTAGAEKQLLAVLADNPLGYPDIKASSCGEAITKLHALLNKPTRAVLADGDVDNAKIDGDKATVHVVGAGMTVELQKISDKWMITGGLFSR